MDLALGLTSPMRRNSKMELPLSVYKSKSFESSMPIHIPMESDSSNMFESSGNCRFMTRLLLSQCGSSYNYMQKSAQFTKGGTAFPKSMLPKEPTLAISISQQTIVGGFVGSKTHAGRSMFGETSLLWDAVVCKCIELMSLVKEKPNAASPKSKLASSDTCISGMDDYKNLQTQASKEIICDSESVQCSGSKKCVPRNYRVSNSTDSTNSVPKSSPRCVPIECKAVVPEPMEPNLGSSKDMLPPHRGTYSSVVDGSFKSACARSGSCTMVNLNEKDQLPEGFQTSLPRAPLQSYADVAKIIPNKKPMARPNKSGCEIAQNLKNMWNCRIKRNKINQDKKVNCQGNQIKNNVMDDFVSIGDTRWKEDWKSKRAKFQRRNPTAIPNNAHSSSSSETSEENCIKETFTKEINSDTGSECNRTMDKREIHAGYLKEGLRGRHPSECSLDSEDSFVIFEECPDTALATSSRTSIDHNSSLDEGESEDDDSNFSSDNSDCEDDDGDDGEYLWKFDCLSSNSCVQEDCKWISKYSAQTVPEKSRGMKKKMVHFAEGSHLAVIRPMIAWGYAYRESRRGPWEVHARDRARFHCRIASVAPVLNAILDPLHRRKVVASRLEHL